MTSIPDGLWFLAGTGTSIKHGPFPRTAGKVVRAGAWDLRSLGLLTIVAVLEDPGCVRCLDFASQTSISSLQHALNPENRPGLRRSSTNEFENNAPFLAQKGEPLWKFPIDGRFAVNHVGDVSACTKELHYLFAFAGQLRPT